MTNNSGAESNHRHADFQTVVAGSRGLIINHLQRLPALVNAAHTKAHSWHTQSDLGTFLAQDTEQDLAKAIGDKPRTQAPGHTKSGNRGYLNAARQSA